MYHKTYTSYLCCHYAYTFTPRLFLTGRYRYGTYLQVNYKRELFNFFLMLYRAARWWRFKSVSQHSNARILQFAVSTCL